MAFGLFILLFIVLPNVIVAFMQKHIPSVVLVNLLEGVLRIAIFLVYIVAISKMEDIQRVLHTMAQSIRLLLHGRQARS